jgi:RND family efflux transporter MFP subunit
MNKIVPLTLICVTLSCAEKHPQDTRVQRVKVVRAETRMSQDELVLLGTAAYREKADIYPPFDAILEDFPFQEGDEVRAGQILAVLDTELLSAQLDEMEAERDSKAALYRLACEKLKAGEREVRIRLTSIETAKARLLKAEADFNLLSSRYEKRRKLFEAGGVSAETLETLFAEYEKARASVIEAESEISMLAEGYRDENILRAGLPLPSSEEERLAVLTELNTLSLAAERDASMHELKRSEKAAERVRLLIEKGVLRSPISGVIAGRYAETGERVTQEKKLCTVFNADSVYVDIDVSEKDLETLSEGGEASIRSDNDETERKGNIVSILPFISPETRSSRVRILTENSLGRLKPGQYVKVRIPRGDPVAVVSIPIEAAILGMDDTATVFLVRNGRLFKRDITYELEDETRLAADGSLSPGDILCLRPSRSFRDGMPVEVSEVP